MIPIGFNLDHLKNVLKKLWHSSRPRKVDVPIWLILNKGLIHLVSKMFLQVWRALFKSQDLSFYLVIHHSSRHACLALLETSWTHKTFYHTNYTRRTICQDFDYTRRFLGEMGSPFSKRVCFPPLPKWGPLLSNFKTNLKVNTLTKSTSSLELVLKIFPPMWNEPYIRVKAH